MTVTFQIFAILAGLLHVMFWVLESLLFTRPTVFSRFGVRSAGDAEIIKPMALNQGYYNLFLALGAIGGAVFASHTAAKAIAVFSCACMVGAALVLIISNPRLYRAAVIQAAAPLIALIVSLL